MTLSECQLRWGKWPGRNRVWLNRMAIIYVEIFTPRRWRRLKLEGDKLTLSECNIRASAEDGENGRGEIEYGQIGWL